VDFATLDDAERTKLRKTPDRFVCFRSSILAADRFRRWATIARCVTRISGARSRWTGVTLTT